MYTIEVEENTLDIFMGVGEFENIRIKFEYKDGNINIIHSDSEEILLIEKMEWEVFMDTYYTCLISALESGRKNKDYTEIFIGIFENDY